MAERRDFGPTGYQLPAVVLLARALEHLPILDAVAVRVNRPVSGQIVLLSNSPCLLSPATVPFRISAREAACTLLEHRADEVEAVRVTPRRQIHVKGCGHDDDVIAPGSVPFDALEGLRPDLARKDPRRVVPASLEDPARWFSSKRHVRGNLPSTARGYGSQSIPDGHRQQKRTRCRQLRWRNGDRHERRPRVRRCDRAVEVKKGEVHRASVLQSSRGCCEEVFSTTSRSDE